MPRSAAFLAMVLAMSLPAGAQVYKWTDEHGRAHFSDSPPEQGNASVVDTTPRNIADGVATTSTVCQNVAARSREMPSWPYRTMQ